MDGKIIIKNDQEPSVQYFIKDLVESRESGRSILEESPIKSSGSNGVVERGRRAGKSFIPGSPREDREEIGGHGKGRKFH